MARGSERRFPAGFPDARLKGIHERLTRLVGPGPADFFLDACEMMARPRRVEPQNELDPRLEPTKPSGLRTASHLAAHCLREVEGAIRCLLREPVADNGDRRKRARQVREFFDRLGLPHADHRITRVMSALESNTHAEEIRLAITALGMDEADPAAQKWLSLGGIHQWAHRRGQRDVREVDQEFRDVWSAMVTILDRVLDRFETRYEKMVIERIEELSRLPPRQAIKVFKRDVPYTLGAHDRFLASINGPDWLEPLIDGGFFEHPPPLEEDEEDGSVRHPPWPVLRYLTRLATEEPALQRKIVETAAALPEMKNVTVMEDLADVAMALDAELAAELVPRLRLCLDGTRYGRLPLKFGDVVSHLSKGGQPDSALVLARDLLAVVPDEREKLAPAPRPKAMIDGWTYEEVLKRTATDLVTASHRRALELLCDVLEESVRLSLREPRPEDGEDFSYLWRRAVEDHVDNYRDEVRGHQVAALLSAVLEAVRGGLAVTEALEVLSGRNWYVFERVALAALAELPDVPQHLLSAWIVDRDRYERYQVEHEYARLLTAKFSALSDADRTAVLGWATEEDDPSEWLDRMEAHTGTRPTDEERREWQEKRILERLGPFADQLPDDWAERKRKWSERHGEPDVEVFHLKTGVEWIGPKSPKGTDDLREMTVEQVASFLRDWRAPKGPLAEESPEGLGRSLVEVVREKVGEYSAGAAEFKGLEPTYVRSVLRGLQEAVEAGDSITWEPVIALCEWVMEQPVTEEEERPGIDRDPGWSWTRKGIASLVAVGMSNADNAMALSVRERVWALIEGLLSDSDPTPEYEREYGGSNMDATTLAINSTRGNAVNAAIQYAVWVCLGNAREAGAEDVRRSRGQFAEAADALEMRLRNDVEPSPAVRSVLGRRFPALAWLDEAWAKELRPRVFPPGEKNAAYREAAWESYLAFNGPNAPLLELLHEEYARAVEFAEPPRADVARVGDPEVRLAEHVALAYGRGSLALDDPDGLFARFLHQAPGRVRGALVGFVGRSLGNNGTRLPEDIVRRFREYADRRLADADEGGADVSEELRPFGYWFTSDAFDEDWRLKTLLRVVQATKSIEPSHTTIEGLVETSTRDPGTSVRCARHLVEGDRNGWEVLSYPDRLRTILSNALDHGDENAKREAADLVNRLLSLGRDEYEDLLP